MPLWPTVVDFPDADETVGLGQSESFRIRRYVSSTLGGGGKSLPFSQVKTEGWRSSLRIWSRRDSAAACSSSASHFPHSSHWSQQHQPAITRMPRRSQRSRKWSSSSLPS